MQSCERIFPSGSNSIESERIFIIIIIYLLFYIAASGWRADGFSSHFIFLLFVHLSVSPPGRGAAMIIESLRLFYHIGCFRCCVCGIALGNGTAGTDVRVRNNHLHCHDCYSNDEGITESQLKTLVFCCKYRSGILTEFSFPKVSNSAKSENGEKSLENRNDIWTIIFCARCPDVLKLVDRKSPPPPP